MTNEDFEYAKRFEDWLKGENLNGIQEDVLKLRIENEKLRKENEELKEELSKKADTNHSLVEQMADLESENTELKEELKKWKDEWQEQVQKAIDEGYARTLQTMQLTKAKEIIEKVAKMYRYSPKAEEIIEQAEQFLKEIEK